ncbi:MAG: flagellar hook capping protein [Firmicutes bacterium]|nr:flagellar hook capping protein [Bacillota bacterium]
MSSSNLAISSALNNALGSASSSSSSSAAVSSSSVSSSSQLGESAFLTLLSAELKYQDPLQPVNNTQFISELAQFSQLSAVTQQSQTLQNILTAVQHGSPLMNAATLIGKTVTAAEGSGVVTGISDVQGSLLATVSGIGPVPVSSITAISAGSAAAVE